MKCVLEIGWSPEDRISGAGCVIVDTHPYVNRCDEAPEYKGGYASITVHGRNSTDAVQIDGSIDDIRDVLVRGLEDLTSAETHYRQQYEERRAHSLNCPLCKCWYDSRESTKGHPDGKGNTCEGGVH